MYHLTAWPTYKKTVPMFCHKMFRNGFSLVQLGSAEGKQDKRRCRFVHKVLKQTRNMDTFLGRDSYQNFFHTSTWNVVNEVFHGGNALNRPGDHNNTLLFELVNCKSLPVSSMGRPPGETCFFRLKRNDQVQPCWTLFSHYGHVIARKHKDLVYSSSAK